MDSSDEADELRRAMGFSSFGAPRKRARRSVEREVATDELVTLTQGAGSASSSLVEKHSVVVGPHKIKILVNDYDDHDVVLKALQQSKETDAAKISNPRSGELLAELEREKQRFEPLDATEFSSARSVCNRFEPLGRHRFVNRSAMKLAALDRAFGWTRASKESEVWTFADICGGPGGFSEYLLWRCTDKHSSEACGPVEGFGISLRDAATRCDWRLPPGLARVSVDGVIDGETSEATKSAAFAISYGADGTGDLYNLANVHSFRDTVRERHPNGVDLVVADGGFPDARDLDNQEAIMTRLVAAEVLAMFLVLRSGGDFVCKTFELATPAMLEIVWLLHQSFAELTVVKPVTSRPASSERYIVARNLRVKNLPLQALVNRLEACVGSNNAVLLNREPLANDARFLEFMVEMNDSFALSQIAACQRILEFVSATNKRKTAIRNEQLSRADVARYFRHWQLGDRDE